MSTSLQACEIVLPGYTLADRIGSGGYAEVWRAEAPGGIQKAVKIVYGYYDDEFACQELKALERIKGVRHPFLLSLERFEIINGRLAILTELADMSLDQRLRQCRADGLPGIPREELLQYMADAAEALDFLSQRHNLLHLDIKPENLLILGDHIKVADFGLVKELASRTQNSLVSGMTPTYASPEMFDDEPTAHSDQYSLAIVYQEMLVGVLPFPGRTAAQLAKQHTQAEPQLMALPAEDRPTIARALAKNPTERFKSCKAFVDALLHGGECGAEPLPSHAPRPTPIVPPAPSLPGPDDTKPTSVRMTIHRAAGQPIVPPDVMRTQPIVRGGRAAEALPQPVPEPFVPEDSSDVAVPATNVELAREQPTLFVAIGGVGIQVLCRMRSLTAEQTTDGNADEATESLALDTDRDELREACSSRWKMPLSSDDTLHLPLRLPKSYDNSREILGWVSRRWLYNIPRSLETRGYRPLGRVALVDHSQRVLALLNQKFERLAAKRGGSLDSTFRVVLVAAMGGGTGAGMVLDAANVIRSVAQAREIKVEVQCFLLCTCFGGANASPLVAANTYSLLTELNHAAERGNLGAAEQAGKASPFVSQGSPFDSLYCIPVRARSGNTPGTDSLDSVAKYLAMEATPDARVVLRSCRVSQTPREAVRTGSLTIKTLGVASLADTKRELVRELAAELAEAVKQHWLTKDTSANWAALVEEEQKAASVPKLEAPVDGNSAGPPVVVPVNDVSPLALRARFKEYLSLKFVNEVLLQTLRQLEARDNRGRSHLLPRDAKLIADTARTVVSSLAARVRLEPNGDSRFAGSPLLCGLIAQGSERVVASAVEKFDPKQPDRFLPADAIDELIRAECLTLLDEQFAKPDIRDALAQLMQLDEAIARTLEHSKTDLLQCGCDRRTILFVPKDCVKTALTERLLAERPLAAIVPADVEDVVVVSEDAGISPRSFARGLDRVFPGVADAARRLLTRIDIEWKNLV